MYKLCIAVESKIICKKPTNIQFYGLIWVKGVKTFSDSFESVSNESGIPKNIFFGVRISQIGSRIVDL